MVIGSSGQVMVSRGWGGGGGGEGFGQIVNGSG